MNKEIVMKLWRKEARKHNQDAGTKHQGRKYKTEYNRNFCFINPLLKAMFLRAGIKLDKDTA
jgi:hypothetical protein